MIGVRDSVRSPTHLIGIPSVIVSHDVLLAEQVLGVVLLSPGHYHLPSISVSSRHSYYYYSLLKERGAPTPRVGHQATVQSQLVSIYTVDGHLQI